MKVLERLGKNVMRRVGYSEFINRVKKLTYVINKHKLALKRLSTTINNASTTLLTKSFLSIILYSQSSTL